MGGGARGHADGQRGDGGRGVEVDGGREEIELSGELWEGAGVGIGILLLLLPHRLGDKELGNANAEESGHGHRPVLGVPLGALVELAGGALHDGNHHGGCQRHDDKRRLRNADERGGGMGGDGGGSPPLR
uniref:Uncharacterized protein n=1 Tax=Oryza rufipogon TaxID=4529 RepID=A0A0E0PIN3_ORYRU